MARAILCFSIDAVSLVRTLDLVTAVATKLQDIAVDAVGAIDDFSYSGIERPFVVDPLLQTY